MKKIIHVQGMACVHCENRVKKALEAFPQVDEALVSRNEKTAVVCLNSPIEDSILIQTIEKLNFQVLGIE